MMKLSLRMFFLTLLLFGVSFPIQRIKCGLIYSVIDKKMENNEVLLQILFSAQDTGVYYLPVNVDYDYVLTENVNGDLLGGGEGSQRVIFSTDKVEIEKIRDEFRKVYLGMEYLTTIRIPLAQIYQNGFHVELDVLERSFFFDTDEGMERCQDDQRYIDIAF